MKPQETVAHLSHSPPLTSSFLLLNLSSDIFAHIYFLLHTTFFSLFWLSKTFNEVNNKAFVINTHLDTFEIMCKIEIIYISVLISLPLMCKVNNIINPI